MADLAQALPMGATSHDRFVIRWQQLLFEGSCDGHWRAFFDRDEYIPRRAMSWLIDSWRWAHWSDDPGHFQRPWSLAGYRYWFQLFHDATGMGCVVHYPLNAQPGDAITVRVTGLSCRGGQGYQAEVPWIHGEPGLVDWELTPLLEQEIVHHQAAEARHYSTGPGKGPRRLWQVQA